MLESRRKKDVSLKNLKLLSGWKVSTRESCGIPDPGLGESYKGAIYLEQQILGQ